MLPSRHRPPTALAAQLPFTGTSLPFSLTEEQQQQQQQQQLQQHSSVHLRLGSEAMMPKDDNDEDDPSGTQKKDHAVLHTYKHLSPLPLYGLNVSREKFEQWIYHCLPSGARVEAHDVTSQDVSIRTIRHELRTLWRSRRLLCDRTELLTVYQSDTDESKETEGTIDDVTVNKKRGGFTDLLHLYAERHIGILEDEIEDKPNSIVQWLQSEYGGTSQLLAQHFDTQTPEAQRAALQFFLEWFRTNFPYFYDKCHACGASCKQDGLDDGSFLGYVYPNDDELAGKAGRTEIYQCHKCHTVTRFPRFNAASHVLQERRGRCGEYSMLLYRMMRAMGHEVRWIVDWADHVWCELFWQGRWIHLDPCEAAIDVPFLYQEWGKQQTYIMAFYAPLNNKRQVSSCHPTIEDVTAKYTSEGMDVIQERRDTSPENVDSTIAKVSLDLESKLANVMMR